MAEYTIDKFSYSNNTYNLEDNTETRSDHRHYEDDLVPIYSKTYTTGYYATAADQATSTFYWMSIRPDDWNRPWKVHFKTYTWVPGQSAYHSLTYTLLTGRTNSFSYSDFNELNTTAHYYITFMPLKSAGYTAGYGHAVAMSMFYASNYTNSSYKRNFQVDVYSVENCTVTLLNEPVLQANWTGYSSTNYENVSNLNAASRGLQETGDANDVNYYHRLYSNRFITSAALYRYQLVLTQNETTVVPMNSVNNSVETNKTLTTASFDPFGPIYYYSSTTTYSANARIATDATFYDQYRFDLRYATNVGSTLTQWSPVYLVMEMNSDGKTAKLHSTPIAQTLPSTEDGLLYRLLGIAYSTYQIEMFLDKPIYQYKNGELQQVLPIGDIETTDEKVGVTLATTTKAYILGTSTTPTSTQQDVKAIADTGVYLDTTAGRLTATSFSGSGAALTSINASNISSGTIPAARINGATLSSINASNISSGTIPAARINGATLSSINASNISSGTLATARLNTSGVTAGSYGPSANATPAAGANFSVPYITVDTYGRVTAAVTRNITIPSVGAAAAKAVDTSIADESTSANLPTSAAVAAFVEGKGYVTTDTTYSAGTGLSLSGTTFNHENSITAGTAGGTAATSGASISIPYVTYDSEGHISAAGTRTHTVTGFAASSHSHGNISSTGDITTTATIASGDRLVINDESASKVTSSSITFGSSTTTYLRNDGTWGTPTGGSQILSGTTAPTSSIGNDGDVYLLLNGTSAGSIVYSVLTT